MDSLVRSTGSLVADISSYPSVKVSNRGSKPQTVPSLSSVNSAPAWKIEDLSKLEIHPIDTHDFKSEKYAVVQWGDKIVHTFGGESTSFSDLKLIKSFSNEVLKELNSIKSNDKESTRPPKTVIPTGTIPDMNNTYEVLKWEIENFGRISEHHLKQAIIMCQHFLRIDANRNQVKLALEEMHKDGMQGDQFESLKKMFKTTMDIQGALYSTSGVIINVKHKDMHLIQQAMETAIKQNLNNGNAVQGGNSEDGRKARDTIRAVIEKISPGRAKKIDMKKNWGVKMTKSDNSPSAASIRGNKPSANLTKLIKEDAGAKAWFTRYLQIDSQSANGAFVKEAFDQLNAATPAGSGKKRGCGQADIIVTLAIMIYSLEIENLSTTSILEIMYVIGNWMNMSSKPGAQPLWEFMTSTKDLFGAISSSVCDIIQQGEAVWNNMTADKKYKSPNMPAPTPTFFLNLKAITGCSTFFVSGQRLLNNLDPLIYMSLGNGVTQTTGVLTSTSYRSIMQVVSLMTLGAVGNDLKYQFMDGPEEVSFARILAYAK